MQGKVFTESLHSMDVGLGLVLG